jgi:hypothetical protein
VGCRGQPREQPHGADPLVGARHPGFGRARRRSEAFGATVGPGDLFGSVSAPGSNVFLIKTSFWIPVG